MKQKLFLSPSSLRQGFEFFVGLLDSDVGAAPVLAETLRGNPALVLRFPHRLVATFADAVVSHGRDPEHLQVLEALTWLPDPNAENNPAIQFEVLRELTRPAREEHVMFLAVAPGSSQYAQRRSMMLDAKVSAAAAERQAADLKKQQEDARRKSGATLLASKIMGKGAGAAASAVIEAGKLGPQLHADQARARRGFVLFSPRLVVFGFSFLVFSCDCWRRVPAGRALCVNEG
jgi:hypothetical protein